MIRNATTLGLMLVLVCTLGLSGCKDDAGSGQQDGAVGADSTTQTDGGVGSDSAVQQDSGPEPSPDCPALDPPTGTIVNVSDVAGLVEAVNDADPGDRILLADGEYVMDNQYLWISTPDVELRSASGNRGAVVLDSNYQGSEIITIAANNVTVADLTLREAYTHAFHVVSDGADTLGTLIYNVHVIDSREQAIKINPNTPGTYPDDGVIACSTLELTDDGRPHVNPTSGGCYTGGVDGHQMRNWVIRDNIIRGFWCNTGLSEHGVHCWRGCRDTVVERNYFIDNARGVGFGMASSGEARTFTDDPCPGVSGYVGHYGGVVRNNFIFVSDPDLLASPDGFDCGICFWSACYAQALHNTIVSTGSCFSSIEWRYAASTGIEIINNIATHQLREREGGASANLDGNLTDAQLSLFVDGAGGDLHLAPTAAAAIDQGASVPPGMCTDDIDGDARDASPDVGADEHVAP